MEIAIVDVATSAEQRLERIQRRLRHGDRLRSEEIPHLMEHDANDLRDRRHDRVRIATRPDNTFHDRLRVFVEFGIRVIIAVVVSGGVHTQIVVFTEIREKPEFGVVRFVKAFGDADIGVPFWQRCLDNAPIPTHSTPRPEPIGAGANSVRSVSGWRATVPRAWRGASSSEATAPWRRPSGSTRPTLSSVPVSRSDYDPV
uniref:Uncharacterized protein n=1 Tax=Spongospora subterranea TaxID=70186 RepID=A0A0H5RAW1_9EUKA|eukprot:CRZ10936.1 hypothetical protein [Spongospora subterranea]